MSVLLAFSASVPFHVPSRVAGCFLHAMSHAWEAAICTPCQSRGAGDTATPDTLQGQQGSTSPALKCWTIYE
jgi:hypothetical protein